MSMDPKQLGALVARETKKTDDRARPALNHYDVKPKRGFTPQVQALLDTIKPIQVDDVEEESSRAIAREQDELAKAHGELAAKDFEEDLKFTPDTTPLDDLLE